MLVPEGSSSPMPLGPAVPSPDGSAIPPRLRLALGPPLSNGAAMRLHLLRHAEAAPGIPDAGRALTERGRAQVDRMAELMDWSFVSGLKQIEHSGLVRARQTAEQLLQRLGSKLPAQVRPGLRPNDEPVMIGLDLATCKEDRFLVGHNPHLGRLAGLLLARGGSEVALVVKKAGYLALERVRPADKENPFGQWALLWMISPGRLASRKE